MPRESYTACLFLHLRDGSLRSFLHIYVNILHYGGFERVPPPPAAHMYFPQMPKLPPAPHMHLAQFRLSGAHLLILVCPSARVVAVGS